MTITDRQKKDFKVILEFFKNVESANDSTNIQDAIKGQPRHLQSACSRFMMESFEVSEIVGKALVLRQIVMFMDKKDA